MSAEAIRNTNSTFKQEKLKHYAWVNICYISLQRKWPQNIFPSSNFTFDSLDETSNDLNKNHKFPKEDEVKQYESLWTEINNSMAENYFIQTEEISKSTESGNNSFRSQSEDTEVWETPRASWQTTSDGYIEAMEIEKVAMKAVTGYSKIMKNKKYDKIITEDGPQQNQKL